MESRLCGDPHHNHTVHGGSFWAEAWYAILSEVRAGTAPKSSVFMTEGTQVRDLPCTVRREGG